MSSQEESGIVSSQVLTSVAEVDSSVIKAQETNQPHKSLDNSQASIESSNSDSALGKSPTSSLAQEATPEGDLTDNEDDALLTNQAQEEIFPEKNGHGDRSSEERNGEEYSDEDADGEDEDEDELDEKSSTGVAKQTTAPAFAQDGVALVPEDKVAVTKVAETQESSIKSAAVNDSTSPNQTTAASVQGAGVHEIFFPLGPQKIHKKNLRLFVVEEEEPSVEEEIIQEQAVSQESKADTILPETVTRLDTPYGSSVYLVGTAHFSKESQDDVAITIRTVRPDIVVVELCKARTAILQLDEETILQESRNLDRGIILDRGKIMMILRQHGTIQGLLYILLLSVSAHITKELGMAPGGEFRTAFAEARRSAPGCIMQLGDRPISITLARALASLSLWHKIKLTWHMITSKEPISKEEVEKCKQRDFIEEMLAEMTGQFPAISEVFVKERDIYLCRSLQAAAHPIPDPNSPTGVTGRVVVGVVGIGHVPGIVERWGKVTEADIPPIMRIPPPSRTSQIVKATFKLSFYGLVAYSIYRVTPATVKSTITQSIQSLITRK